MKSLFLALLFLTFGQESLAQSFSYSFSGTLTSENKEKFKKELYNLPSVLSVDLRLKQDSGKGEILFSIEPMNDRGENDHPFSPVDLKSLLIAYGLEPNEFRQLK
jgi:hypothetical protein